jgi:MYXO-CTERM domain-containing protein
MVDTLILCWAVSLAACRGGQAPAPTSAGPAAGTRVAGKSDYGKLPLSFEPNRGQADARADFLARGAGYSLLLGPTEALLSLRNPAGPAASTGVPARIAGGGRGSAALPRRSDIETSLLRMRLLGANAGAVAAGQAPLPGKVNYYGGADQKHWQEDIPPFARVRYSHVYPGVDLVYYGNQGQLEYDFVIAPGANPADIRLAFDGATPTLDAEGDLVLKQGGAEVRLRKPVVYQEALGSREPVAGHYAVSGTHEVAFAVAGYDSSRPLVVDPVLVYSTYLGGTNDDRLHGLAVDSTGSAVVVGQTPSADFPVTSGAFQSTSSRAGGNGTGFITKLSPDGSSLVFSTFLGGSIGDVLAAAVAVGPQDNIYVAGKASTNASSGTNFPTTGGAFQATSNLNGVSDGDGFVTELTPDGKIVYSTYLGGSYNDYAIGIAVDAVGDAFVTGNTTSYNTIANGQVVPLVLFPTTANAYMGPFAMPKDPATESSNVAYMPFLAELNPTGTALVYSTLLGASTCDPQCQDGSACSAQGTCATGGCSVNCLNDSIGQGVAIDGGGIAYIGGWTSQPNFPTTSGSLKPIAPPRLNPNGAGGGVIGFVAAFDPTKSGASSLKYSTFLGGQTPVSGDAVYGIAADANGHVYVTGQASSHDFPTTAASYQPTCPLGSTGCGYGAYVAKLDPTGSTLIYSTFLRSTVGGNTLGFNVRLDSATNAYVVGQVSDGQFPLVNPIQSMADGISLFVLTLSADGSKLLFSTYLDESVGGGNSVPFGYQVGLALDQSANIYVGSITSSTKLVTTAGAFQSTLHGSNDGFVTKISAIGVQDSMPDGGVGGSSGGGGAAGSGGGGGSGLGGAAGGKAGSNGGGGAAGRASETGGAGSSSGCGCDLGARMDQPTSLFGLGLVAFFVLRRRRRPHLGSDGAPDSVRRRPLV